MLRNSGEFKQLQKEWNKRLEESGFEDAEKDVGGERALKLPSNCVYRQETDEVVRESKLSYFMLLAQKFAEEKEFSDEWDRKIMERTAEGWSIKEISEELRGLVPTDRERTKHNRDTIRYVRRRYEHKWGIKVWLPHQMQSRKAPTR